MPQQGVETDLAKIAWHARENKEENLRFKNFLKAQNGRKLDILVNKLHDEVAAKIDCTACGNCCKQLSPCLTKADIKNIATAVDMPIEETIDRYTEPLGSDLSLKHLPCIFLKENMCTVYQYRPETCASFPHLHKEGFNTQLRRHLDNYSICPITFNVIERLKNELHFSPKQT
jgi:Fe-S-cluster containining protein